MNTAYAFTSEGAKRIAAAVKRVEQSPLQIKGVDRTSPAPTEASFWARITAHNPQLNRFSWVRAVPDGSGGSGGFTDLPDLGTGTDNAFAVNGRRDIKIGEVIYCQFIGYEKPTDDSDITQPLYAFIWAGFGQPINDQQRNSALMQARFLAAGIDDDQQRQWMIHNVLLHFHDASHGEIAWNDAQAIRMWNAATGDDLPVPMTASEGYNQHGHTGPYDGGWIPGRGIHDHRDNFNGGLSFAVFHPGTGLPQQPWGI
jgi:hypothetical protein